MGGRLGLRASDRAPAGAGRASGSDPRLAASGSPPRGTDGLDPLASAVLARGLPTLEPCLDEVRMAGVLERVLLPGRLGRYRVVACRRVETVLLPGDHCVLRFQLEIADRLSAETWNHLVTTRVWPNQSDARSHEARLQPLLARAAQSVDLEPLAAPVATVEEMNASVAAFPLEEDAPALLDAADPTRIAQMLSRAFGGGRPGPAIAEARVVRAHPGGTRRWVLRYEAEVAWRRGRPEQMTVYGTVAPGDWGKRSGEAAGALRRRLSERTAAGAYAVPEFFGFVQSLGLGLFGAMGGAPALERLLAERARGGRADPWGLTLEGALEATAVLISQLHSCGVRAARRRDGLEEVGRLAVAIRRVEAVSGDLPPRLEASLEQAARRLRDGHPLPAGPAHGELRPQRLLFEGHRCALVGFDAFCRAEPARDLGLLLAALAITAAVAAGDAARAQRLMDGVRNRLVAAYVAAGDERLDPDRVLERTSAYELIGVLRLALESWHGLERERLLAAMALLDGA